MTGEPKIEPNSKNALEWTVFGFSLLLVCAVAGFLVAEIIRGDNSAASLKATPGKTSLHENSLSIPIIVENNGGRAAKTVKVRVQIISQGKTLEPSLEFENIPSRATARGTIVLQGATRLPESPPILTTSFEDL